MKEALQVPILRSELPQAVLHLRLRKQERRADIDEDEDEDEQLAVSGCRGAKGGRVDLPPQVQRELLIIQNKQTAL